MTRKTCVAIIGGSGLYEIEGIQETEEVTLETPFGPPSAAIVRGKLSDIEVLFLARHGKGHRFMPTEVNARANIFALKLLGAKWCIGIGAVGSLREDYKPGDFIVPEQVIDRTRLRNNTFFGQGIVAHVGFADPFCAIARKHLYDAAFEKREELAFSVHNSGTYVCMEGPAFSTRAESNLYRQWQADIVGMTVLPEAKLAREAELAYANLSFVTDYDCWREHGDDVDVAAILEILHHSTDNAKKILPGAIKRLATAEPSVYAANALATAILTDLSSTSTETLERLKPLLGRYV